MNRRPTMDINITNLLPACVRRDDQTRIGNKINSVNRTVFQGAEKELYSRFVQ